MGDSTSDSIPVLKLAERNFQVDVAERAIAISIHPKPNPPEIAKSDDAQVAERAVAICIHPKPNPPNNEKRDVLASHVEMVCTQPPPDVTVQIEPGSVPNLVICSRAEPAPGRSLPYDIYANNATSLSQATLPAISTGHVCDHGPIVAIASGASVPLGMLTLLTIASTLWYKRKYHQALKYHQILDSNCDEVMESKSLVDQT